MKTKMNYKELFYEENVEAWMEMAKTREEVEYAMRKIIYGNFADSIKQEAMDFYEDRTGEKYDIYGEEE